MLARFFNVLTSRFLILSSLLQGGEGDVEGSPIIVTMRARRVSTTTTLCVFITAFLVLATGIVGGVYLYRQFTHYKVRGRRLRASLCIVRPQLRTCRMDQPASFHHLTQLSARGYEWECPLRGERSIELFQSHSWSISTFFLIVNGNHSFNGVT